MDITKLEIGTKLELEPHIKFSNENHKLASEFEWLVDSKTMMVAAPIYEGVVYPLQLGTEININFIKKTGQEFELYTFKAAVAAREMHQNLALLKLVMRSEIKKVQRRTYYRLDCSLPVKYRVVDSMDDLVNKNVQFKNTIANNMSGSGMNLLLEEKLEVGKLVECEILPEENKAVRFLGEVIRSEKTELETKFKYEAGIVYIEISNNDREAVVRFIFHEQRKLRKKGLI